MRNYVSKFVLSGVAASLLTSAALAAPVTYTVDDSHTFADFSYTHMGLSKQRHTFDNASGTVTLDQAARKGSVDVTIDMRSVNTGHEGFDQRIQGEDFFDTKNFPYATFKSSGMIYENDEPASVFGTLTIKGVSKPVTFDITHFAEKAHPMSKVPAMGANATATILRSDFNAGKFAPAVSDEVTLELSIEALAK